mgnify:FL=1|jgi:transcriptional regulator with XRE-family HTH domain
MSNAQVGGRIRELREIQNYTREALSEKVEISAKFLYEIETGKKGFSADTLSRIATALSASCDYILFGEKAENCGSEKIICTLESLKPAQRYQIQHILKILYDICDYI